jgi:phenylpyruvate tautomerase PptA (4-oxalocrotonate tautomerase family)
MHTQQKAICEKMKHISNVFDCVRDMDRSIEIIEEVTALLRDFRILWNSYETVIVTINEVKEIKWVNLNAESFEDLSKDLVMTIRKLPNTVLNTDAHNGIDNLVKDFVVTCPIILALRSPAMRERHWKELMKVF